MSAGLRTNYSDGGAPPTATEIVASDMNAISAAVNSLFPSSTSQASSATTLTLTAASDPVQIITGTTQVQTVALPTTSVAEGDQWLVVNSMTTAAVTVQASGGATVTVIGAGTSAIFTAVVNTPTVAADWLPQYGGAVVASGKVLTANNSLTLVGVDGTTVTFPSSSAPAANTLAEYDANSNLSANSFLPNFATVATTNGTTTLTAASAPIQIFTGSSSQTVVMPSTGVVAGMAWTLIWEAIGGNLTVKASGGGTIQTFGPVAAPLPQITVTAMVNAPTTAAGWNYQNPVTNGQSMSLGSNSTAGRHFALAIGAAAASSAPLYFNAGTNLTTPEVGAMEFDGTLWYLSPAASTRNIVHMEQFITLTAAYTLTSQTAAQKLFNATTNGAVTLLAGTYEFDCFYTLSAMSTGTSASFGFALAGTATIAGQLWQTEANKAALATAAAATNTVNTAANTALTAANTTATGWAHVWGKVRISASGTLIPSVSLGAASAAIVGVDSFFRIWPKGAATVTNVGNWS